MILYLSSQKFGNKTEFLREWIEKHGNKILLVFNALDAKGEEKINNNVKDDIFLLEQIGFEITVIDLKNYFDKQDLLEEKIKKYSSICVMGGNVFVLRQAMKYSGLDNILKNKINDDFLYIGYSAGCSVLSENIEIFKNVDDPVKFYNKNEIIYNGLGLIDYVFIPHYKSDYHKVYLIDEVVNRCIKENINYKAITDGEVIIEKINKSESVLKVFNLIAKQYVDYFGDDWEFIDEIEEFTSGFEKRSTIIDLGCGSGYITNFLTEKNLNAIGLDFSTEMIKIAKEKHPNVKYITDDFLNIEDHFKEDTVDGAIAIYSLYFIPKEQLNRFLNTLSKILKKGAKFFFITQIGNEEKYVKTQLMIESGVDKKIYVNYNMKEQLEELLSNNNFTIDYFKQKKVMDDKDITDGGRYIVLATNNK